MATLWRAVVIGASHSAIFSEFWSEVFFSFAGLLQTYEMVPNWSLATKIHTLTAHYIFIKKRIFFWLAAHYRYFLFQKSSTSHFVIRFCVCPGQVNHAWLRQHVQLLHRTLHTRSREESGHVLHFGWGSPSLWSGTEHLVTVSLISDWSVKQILSWVFQKKRTWMGQTFQGLQDLECKKSMCFFSLFCWRCPVVYPANTFDSALDSSLTES